MKWVVFGIALCVWGGILVQRGEVLTLAQPEQQKTGKKPSGWVKLKDDGELEWRDLDWYGVWKMERNFLDVENMQISIDGPGGKGVMARLRIRFADQCDGGLEKLLNGAWVEINTLFPNAQDLVFNGEYQYFPEQCITLDTFLKKYTAVEINTVYLKKDANPICNEYMLEYLKDENMNPLDFLIYWVKEQKRTMEMWNTCYDFIKVEAESDSF